MCSINIEVDTLAGGEVDGFEDGSADCDAYFNCPSGICVSNDGKVYVSDQCNYRIRMISDDMVSTIAGNGQSTRKDGKAEEASFYYIHGICIADDGRIYVLDNSIVMIYDGMVSTIAGCGQSGYRDGKAEDALFCGPSGICISKDGKIYVTDSYNNCIRLLSDGIVSTIAGNTESGFQDGKAENAKFSSPYGICISNDEKCRIYVSDTDNHRIRMISDGIVSTIAGCGKPGFQDGIAEDAKFRNPYGLCMSADGRLYVADAYNSSIRMISGGIVSTIAGNGKEGYEGGKARNSMFNFATDICASNDGQLYVSDTRNHVIRKISGLPISPNSSFELSSLLHSKSLSDMTLTINNHQYHLHTAVVHSVFPMIIKHKSLIEDAKVSHESLQTMFEMIYSNNPNQIIRLTKQYEMTDLTHLVELIWLFESFEIKDTSFLITCVLQYQMELEYFIKQEKYKSTTQLFCLIHNLISISDSIALERKVMTELLDFTYNQIKKCLDETKKLVKITQNQKSVSTLMQDMFLLFGSHTEPRVVDQQQIKSETPETALDTEPDYTIMTHDRSYSIKCHKVILYGKWPYFRRMIESGLLESASGEMIMSGDWNETRLYDFVKYLYTNEVGFESIEDSRWLLDNAELYELMQKPKSRDNRQSMMAKKRFKLLIETCKKRLGK